MLNLNKIKQLRSDYVCIKRCINGEHSKDGTSIIDGIVIPSCLSDYTNYVEILDVGEGCDLFNKSHCRGNGKHGVTTFVHELPNQILHLIDGNTNEDCLIVTENDLFPFIIEGNKVIPMLDYIVVGTAYEKPDMLFISDMAKHISQIGCVVGIGEKVKEIDIDMNVFLPYNTINFNLGEKFLCCLREKDVLAIIE